MWSVNSSSPGTRQSCWGQDRSACRFGGLRRELRSEQRRIGFTLLELVVVLAIIVLLASLSWPPMLRYIREQEIREQAHVVRMALAGSRVKAIDTGLTYQFRYEPGGQRFVVLPFDLPDAAAGGTSTIGNANSTGPSVQAGTSSTIVAVTVPTATGKLPDSCEFDWPQTINPATNAEQPIATESLPNEWLALLADSSMLQQVTWSPPILFYSDGTTDDIRLTIINEDDRRMDVFVRGLTGATSLGRLK